MRLEFTFRSAPGEAVDERMCERIEEILATTFKPEFLNRIDETVIFHRLSREGTGRA